MASNVLVAGGDDEGEKPRGSAPKAKNDESPGFFHIYKSGQGYWTRMGTVGGAALVLALFVSFIYHNMPVWIGSASIPPATAKSITIYTLAAFVAVYALVIFWVMNKPTNADFLIATDSEMKKVNWTSKAELWGSTKIVIIFMFFIATMLFGFDIIFGYFFYFIKVLQSKPF